MEIIYNFTLTNYTNVILSVAKNLKQQMFRFAQHDE